MSDNGKSEHIGFRFNPALVKRIDEHAKRLSKKTGLKVTRASAVRWLLSKALDSEERAKK